MKQKERASVALIKAVVNLRSVKDKYEIEELEKAAAIGYQMHVTSMKMAKPGIYEREIAGAIEGIALSQGLVSLSQSSYHKMDRRYTTMIIVRF